MKICVISYHANPHESVGAGTSGGMTIYLCNLYGRISRKVEVDVFTSNRSYTCKLGNARIIHIDAENTNEFTSKTLNYMNNQKYDLIHSHYYLSGLSGMKIAEILQIPWVHSFHTVEAFKNIKKDRERIEIEWDIICKSDYLISFTQHEYLNIKKFFPDSKILVIPHGVEINRFQKTRDGNSKLLFVGRIAPIKGLDILMDSLKYIDSKFQLTIIGDKSKNDYYFNSLKGNFKGQRINFKGTVPHESIQQNYSQSSITVIPSFYESFGLVALESMASGRPIIGFNDTGIAEFVGDKAGIFIKRNSRNLARTIEFLLRNKTLTHQMGKIGSEISTKYSWDKVAEVYIDKYRKIIKN